MADPLIAYGIQSESSDFRVHVCPVVRRIYSYPTAMARVILPGGYRLASVRIDGHLTARGYLVPVEAVPELQTHVLPDIWWRYRPILPSMTTQQKGDIATRMVIAALNRGLMHIPVEAEEVTDLAEQIGGIDVRVRCNLRVQVKCDYSGGHKDLGGSGHLFCRSPNET
ncbi:MAG: hypothetical protein HC841_03500 [Verrucomicrobiae bacterium]|nr:hypothetical protein [Verrucomicrobiae bacterium]